VLNLVCQGASEADVIDHVRPIALKIQKAKVDLKEVTGVTRISKKLKDYAKPTLGAKAAVYYNKHMAERFSQPKFDEGDSVPWVYVASSPDWAAPTDIVCYKDISEMEGFTLDWEKMVDRLVKRKVKPIFQALEWDLESASGAARPKRYW
jgi:DNA polymerase elongation subunit (family B)